MSGMRHSRGDVTHVSWTKCLVSGGSATADAAVVATAVEVGGGVVLVVEAMVVVML